MAMFSLAGRFAGDEGAAERYAVGMVALAGMQIVQGGITQTFHYERQFGTLWVLFSSAGSRTVAYLSRGVLHYGNALLSAATTLVFAWLLFDVALPEANWAIVIAAIALMSLSSVAFWLMMGSFVIVLRDWFSAPALAYGLIIALTGAFIPRDALPAPLGDLGLVLPLTWALPALREALGQGETDVAPRCSASSASRSPTWSWGCSCSGLWSGEREPTARTTRCEERRMNDRPQYAVECEALGRVYRFSRGLGRGGTQETVALDDLNLTIAPGSVFGLLGPNGAGKTTTVRILSTLLTPTSGTARVLGHDVVEAPARVRERIGLILGGDRGLYTRLSGRQNLSYHAALNHMDRKRARERREELLGLVGLSNAADTAVERYSRGMKQRLHIARGLLTEPDVVFMDEPTIGLDPVGAQEVRAMIPELAAAGHTILLTTHYMFEADQLCDEVAIINEGKLVARDTPAAVRRRFATFRVVELAVREADLALADRLGALPGVEHVQVGSDGALQTFSIRIPPDADLRSAVEETVGPDNVESLLQRDPTLEEAYLALLS